MKVFINGKPLDVENGTKVEDICGDYDVFVRNGYGINKFTLLKDGDRIIAVKKGQMVDYDNLQDMLVSRNGENVNLKLSKAVVCICGLGGLGSNIASMLARLGIGKLILVDFDIVDPTNLNRQNYFISDIGSLKTEATARIIKNINPYIVIECVNMYLNADNILQVIQNADVVVEAFDNPLCKAEIVNTILENTNKYVVASSGMAGYGSGNDIKTTHPMSKLYVAGDSKSEAGEGNSLMSPRVNICAGHQANMVVRILLNELEC